MLLEDVVSVCGFLAAQAGEVIRAVHRRREDGGYIATQMKDPNDSRTYLTVADQRAQHVIISGIRRKWPNIMIVGEEDEEDCQVGLKDWQDQPQVSLVDSCERIVIQDIPQEYLDVKVEDLCLFVDPVDGTREFVQGRIHSCQTLIGVAWRGRPIAGIVGLPFHDGLIGKYTEPMSSAAGLVICGVVGAKFSLDSLVYDKQEKPELQFHRTNPRDEFVLVSSSKVKEPELIAVCEELNAGSIVKAGGCGNKILRLLTGQADCALLNLACSLWDTCATDALVQCIGGKLTTLAGFPILHSNDIPTDNNLGVIATTRDFERFGRTHDELCLTLRGCAKITCSLYAKKGLKPGDSTPQAVDIVRGINGQPLTASDLSEAVFGDKHTVSSYWAPENETVRYKQSHACRIHFRIPGGKQPSSVFYKRVVLRELPYALFKAKTTPYKLERDVKSCITEANFLESPAVRAFSEKAGVKIALPYKLEKSVYLDHAIDSRFALTLFDFSPSDGWQQYAYLKEKELSITLESLAKMHAFFWLNKPSHKDDGLKERLWSVGSYWHLGRQPKKQIELVSKHWTRIVDVFGDELCKLGASRDQVAKIGERVEKVAEAVSLEAHGVRGDGELDVQAYSKLSEYQTIIHGDPKAPNFFFRNESELGVIDFQWSGIGIGAVDVAYCIAASIDESVATLGGSEIVPNLLAHYHTTLMESFVENNVASNLAEATGILPFPVFRRQFVVAFIDLARVVIGDHWKTITPQVLKERTGKLVFNAYNKSLPVALWFIEQTYHLLNEYGA